MTNNETPLTDADLLYSACTRCECGAGLAYPLDHEAARKLGAWVCARVLKGEVDTTGDVSVNAPMSPVRRADAAGHAHIALPWWCYSVKSEGQPSSNGASTRPVGTHIETEPHCKCKACGHSYVAARRLASAPFAQRTGGCDCPKCGASYLSADGGSGDHIDVRNHQIVVTDAGVPTNH